MTTCRFFGVTIDGQKFSMAWGNTDPVSKGRSSEASIGIAEAVL
jgi:hypothetical protein